MLVCCWIKLLKCIVWMSVFLCLLLLTLFSLLLWHNFWLLYECLCVFWMHYVCNENVVCARAFAQSLRISPNKLNNMSDLHGKKTKTKLWNCGNREAVTEQKRSDFKTPIKIHPFIHIHVFTFLYRFLWIYFIHIRNVFFLAFTFCFVYIECINS